MAKFVAILNVGFLGAVIMVALLAIHGNLRITFVGILCAALTIGMYAAPLSAMVSFTNQSLQLEFPLKQTYVMILIDTFKVLETPWI